MTKLKSIVITGGPGSGKTTLVRELRELGYPTIDEPAHMVLGMMSALLGDSEQQSWRRDTPDHIEWLQENILRIAEVQRDVLAKLESSLTEGGFLFFDRGLHDSLTYFQIHGSPVPQQLTDACRRERYDLILKLEVPPVGIFKTQAGRNTTEREDSVAMGEMLARTYEEYFPGKVISVSWEEGRAGKVREMFPHPRPLSLGRGGK